jgi:hypothetical protein
MKGCASLLLAASVLALLLGGGYWLYLEMQDKDSGPPEVTVENGTAYPLTLKMTAQGKTVSVSVFPGKKETRTISAGVWEVEGTLAGPTTREFRATWTFEDGQIYAANFTREGGEDGELLIALRASQ